MVASSGCLAHRCAKTCTIKQTDLRHALGLAQREPASNAATLLRVKRVRQRSAGLRPASLPERAAKLHPATHPHRGYSWERRSPIGTRPAGPQSA